MKGYSKTINRMKYNDSTIMSTVVKIFQIMYIIENEINEK